MYTEYSVSRGTSLVRRRTVERVAPGVSVATFLYAEKTGKID